MNAQEFKELFAQMKPGFFETDEIKEKPENEIYEEMILKLSDFDPELAGLHFSKEAEYGYYNGDHAKLLADVGRVVEGWPPLFHPDDRIYCGFLNGELASFCLVEDMGTHTFRGKQVKIAGPGCVGTLPEYRRKGIGLAMVRDVTRILKEEGYDYSYIHWTGVAPWYAKLGYESVLKWNCKGFVQ